MGKETKKEYDHLVKVILIGCEGSGKSSFMSKFANDDFSDDYHATIGVDFATKATEEQGNKLKLQIWDTTGQERFASVVSAYYREANVVMVFCDTTNRASFLDIKKYLDNVKTHCKMEPQIILVGAKADLVNERSVSSDELKQVARDNNCQLIEASAKTGEGVEDAFKLAAQSFHKQKTLLVEKERKDKLIEKLNAYVREIEGEREKDVAPGEKYNYGFKFWFPFGKAERAHNREVNYELAKLLRDELGSCSKTIKEIFDEENIKQLRKTAGTKTIVGKYARQEATKDVWWSRLYNWVIKLARNPNQIDKLIKKEKQEQERQQASPGKMP